MLGRLAWRSFALAYASANLLAILAIAAVRDGAFFKRPSEEEKRELRIAQEHYWSVAGSPFPGFKHHFFTLRSGVKLHYVVKTEPLSGGNKPSQHDAPRSVAVVIHGFPDSFILWNKVIQAQSLDPYILIAVDLPGFGGSDSLKTYGPNDVLESITDFLLGMRDEYAKGQAKMVVVGHDWGAVIAARLASEAPQLADRWVISSAIIPQHAYSNAVTKVASAKQMLHTYLRQPLRISLLKNAFATLKPVVSQIRRSFYIFIFNLPYPLSNIFPTFADYWFLRFLHKAAHGRVSPTSPNKPPTYRSLAPKEAAEAIASSSGPGDAQISETTAYSASLKARAPNLGMLEKIRIYREGLALGTWEKSIETVVALSEIQSASRSSSGGSSGALFDDGPPGSLKAPATIVYGLKDGAFEKRLGLDGIGDYLAKDSQVVLLEEVGHWVPLDEAGRAVLEEVVDWALCEEEGPLKERLHGWDKVKLQVAV